MKLLLFLFSSDSEVESRQERRGGRQLRGEERGTVSKGGIGRKEETEVRRIGEIVRTGRRKK